MLFGVALHWVLALDKSLDEPGGAEDAQNKGIEIQQLLGQCRFADGGAFDWCLNLVTHKLPDLYDLVGSVNANKVRSCVRDL